MTCKILDSLRKRTKDEVKSKNRTLSRINGPDQGAGSSNKILPLGLERYRGAKPNSRWEAKISVPGFILKDWPTHAPQSPVMSERARSLTGSRPDK